VPLTVIADLANHDSGGVESHADREPKAVLEAYLVRVAPELVLKLQRCITSTLRVILVGYWGPEERHDAITGVLVDRALEAVDSLGEDREEPA
jgi:hypothetical protein